MWAFGCGVVSSGVPLAERWPLALVGMLLAGPAGLRDQPGGQRLVRPPRRCDQRAAAADSVGPHARAAGASTSRSSGRSLSLARRRAARAVGLRRRRVRPRARWAYSAPPLRLKQNGWWGNAACGLCYEGLAWVTGAAVMAAGAMPDARIVRAGRALQHRRARHHDAQRLQGDRGRPADGHPLAAGAARRRRRRARRVPRDGGAAGGRGRAARRVGTAAACRRRRPRCCSRSSC